MGGIRIRPSLSHRHPLAGCRRTRSPIDEVPSFSTHLSLCSAGFHRLHRSYEEIRLLQGHRQVVVAFFPPTAFADPCKSPRVRTLDVPPPPPSLPHRSRLDFGRRVARHAHPTGSACPRVHFRSVLRFASGFFPTRPRGLRAHASRRLAPRAVAFSSRLLPTRPVKDFHLQSSAHAWHTSVSAPAAAKGSLSVVRGMSISMGHLTPSRVIFRGVDVSSSLAQRAGPLRVLHAQRERFGEHEPRRNAWDLQPNP